jgi:hypothetical protein
MLQGALYVVFLFFFVFSATESSAGILITDDAGPMGKGKFELDLIGEYGHDKDARITAKASDFSATLTYGVIEPVDIVLNVPYQFWSSEDSGSKEKGSGISDLGVEVKWRFYEKEGVSFALKPGFTIPTGDEKRGLGTGRVTAYLYFIASKEIGPWAIHMNLGYTRNENNVDQRKDVWHASVASTFEVVKRLTLVGDIGLGTNTDRSSDTPSAYILGGLTYSVSENVDIGLGIKGGLTRPEKDIAARGGITWRF